MNLKNVDALKKNDKFAAIDIGSHNCRLLISEKNQGVIKSVFNSSKPTNLIKNLSYNNEFNYNKEVGVDVGGFGCLHRAVLGPT